MLFVVLALLSVFLVKQIVYPERMEGIFIIKTIPYGVSNGQKNKTPSGRKYKIECS